MTEQINITPLFMASPSQNNKRNVIRLSKMDKVQECEIVAVNSFKYRNDKKKCPNPEETFITAVKESPSVYTVDLGITLAVEAGWNKVLNELFAVDLSTYAPIKSDSFDRHPLEKQALSSLDLPPASHSLDRWYVNAALLYAIVSGKPDTVKVLAKYMDLNIDDMFGKSLLHYVYLLRQQGARKRILDIVLPKLEPSIRQSMHNCRKW